jgi:predicted DNA-binding transcriptional regulator
MTEFDTSLSPPVPITELAHIRHSVISHLWVQGLLIRISAYGFVGYVYATQGGAIQNQL